MLALLRDEDLPVDGVHPDLEGFHVVEESGRVIGVAGLERYGESGLLRSVAVARGRRGSGLGACLTRAVLAEAVADGLDGVYALTTTAAGYFPRLGFEEIDRGAVPESVRASSEFKTHCPSSAVALRLDLRGGT